ncbi:MAG TPA: DUF2993 domain-containing protein [Terrimesophilobacter sp.]|nr:DUF2993 domain-containing protein [Terrimesophilobacter sp.]
MARPVQSTDPGARVEAVDEFTAEAAPSSSGRRFSRVAWVAGLGLLLSLSLLVAGAVVFENVLRDRVSLLIGERVRTMLSLDPGHPVVVDVGGPPLVLQLVDQRFERIEVATDGVTLGELVGDVTLTATGVPFDASQPVDRVEGHVRVDEQTVAEITSRVTSAVVTSVTLAEPLVKMGTTLEFPAVEIFGVTIIPGFSFEVGVGMEPFVSDGKIAFTPVSFEVEGNELSAAAFADAYRDAAQTLLRVGAICVADKLPEALVLESVVVSGDELIIGLGADNAVFSTESLATRGEC